MRFEGEEKHANAIVTQYDSKLTASYCFTSSVHGIVLGGRYNSVRKCIVNFRYHFRQFEHECVTITILKSIYQFLKSLSGSILVFPKP